MECHPGVWPRLMLEAGFKEGKYNQELVRHPTHFGEGPRAQSELPRRFCPVQACPYPIQANMMDCFQSGQPTRSHPG